MLVTSFSARFGANNVLIKGGHGDGDDAVDVLLVGHDLMRFALPRLESKNTHGTGCTLSAAITALLALDVALPEAVRRAKNYVWQAIAAGGAMDIGHGRGPVDHLYAIHKHGLPT